MIWWDHVFNFGPKSATRVTKFWEKNWRGASRDSFFLEILSLGQFVAWGESGTFCHLGQFVAQKMPVGQLVVGTKCLLTFQSRKQILTLRGVYTSKYDLPSPARLNELSTLWWLSTVCQHPCKFGQYYNNFYSTFKPFPPQDDLPPPARLLPSDPHAHPPKDHRVKVPSGKLFNQGLHFLVFIIGFESLSARCWTGCILDIQRIPRESTVCRFFVLFGFQLFGGA